MALLARRLPIGCVRKPRKTDEPASDRQPITAADEGVERSAERVQSAVVGQDLRKDSRPGEVEAADLDLEARMRGDCRSKSGEGRTVTFLHLEALIEVAKSEVNRGRRIVVMLWALGAERLERPGHGSGDLLRQPDHRREVRCGVAAGRRERVATLCRDGHSRPGARDEPGGLEGESAADGGQAEHPGKRDSPTPMAARSPGFVSGSAADAPAPSQIPRLRDVVIEADVTSFA